MFLLKDGLGSVIPLTVKEYCEHEKIDFAYVWDFVRKK